jgi:hypothetical protein
VNVLQVIIALEKLPRNLLVHLAHMRLLPSQSRVLFVRQENLRQRKVPKNVRIVHRVGTVGTKTLIRPHALNVHWGNILPKRVNPFVWRATADPLQTNTVQRSVKFAQQDLHKVKNVALNVFDAKTVCCPTKICLVMKRAVKEVAVLLVLSRLGKPPKNVKRANIWTTDTHLKQSGHAKSVHPVRIVIPTHNTAMKSPIKVGGGMSHG